MLKYLIHYFMLKNFTQNCLNSQDQINNHSNKIFIKSLLTIPNNDYFAMPTTINNEESKIYDSRFLFRIQKVDGIRYFWKHSDMYKECSS